MFRIKICGVTSAGDAEFAASMGADAVGINFFRGSKRYVPPEEALPIVEAVRGKAEPVAVFVNESPAVMAEVCGRLGIGVVQLSGDEPAGTAKRLSLRRIKAIHCGGNTSIDAFREYPCEAFLVDAEAKGAYGGTGIALDWKMLAGLDLGRPWILAGGLTPENVLAAIRAAGPNGVDVASGVESSPGRKDPEKVRRFITMARKGLGD